MKVFIFVVAVLFVTFTAGSNAVGTHLYSSDIARLNNLFKNGLDSDDLQALYYAAINLPNLTLPEKQKVCKHAVDVYAHSNVNDSEKVFYFVGTLHALDCLSSVSTDIKTQMKISFKKETTTTAQELYFKMFAYNKIEKIDLETQAKVSQNLQQILKKDDSLINLGYAFHIASALNDDGSFLLNWIENAVAQADEVNGEMLQFEGGLSITGLVVSGILKLTSSQKKPCPLNYNQMQKFAIYFLSRRSVQTVKGGSILLESLRSISQHGDVSPICISLIGNGQISSDAQAINFKIVDLLGNSVISLPKSVNVNISLKNSTPGNNIQKVAIPKSSDNTIFAVDISSEKMSRGLYIMNVHAAQIKQTVQFTILGRIKVKHMEVGVGDIDSTSAIKKHIAVYPNKIDKLLTADVQQRVVLKVVLLDEETEKPISVHQSFIRFNRKNTKEEIIFVAEQDSSKAYKFEMDVGGKSAPFNSRTDDYLLELIVGDASLSNSFKWHVADFHMKFSSDATEKVAFARKSADEIVHQFRQPENRPPKLFSDLFSGLCFAPLLLLIIMWLKLKVNISNFPISLCSVGFHCSLGSIFCLFFIFWFKLNMFITIQYLIPLAIVTFLSGNRLLRNIASKKQSDSNL